MSNQFLPFATSGGANALTPAEWAGLTAILANGFQSGVASSEQFNTAFRQALAGTNLLGNFIKDQGFNALDDGNTVNLLNALKSALTTLLATKNGDGSTVFQAADGASGKQVVNISQFASTFGASGSQALPGGFVFKWGTASFGSVPGASSIASTAFTLPSNFLTVNYGVWPVLTDKALSIGVNSVSTSGFIANIENRFGSALSGAFTFISIGR